MEGRKRRKKGGRRKKEGENPDLESRERLGRVLPDRSLHALDFRPSGEHHGSRDHLSVLLVGRPKGNGLGDGRVRQQRAVDLDRRNLLPSAVDELFQPSCQGDVAVLIQEALVSLVCKS